MTERQIGVVLTEAPQPWAIIQQRNGVGTVELAGRWLTNGDAEIGEPQVYVRVVNEQSGETVSKWKTADMAEGQAWSIRLDNVPAGGLYRIETGLRTRTDEPMEWMMRGDMVHHVGIGDLWIIAGQSNAAGYGKGPVNDPPEFGVHLFRNNGRWDLATHPFNESTGTLHIENRETGNPGHSPYMAFARIVKRETGWPIGLVQTALGGSPLRAWNPAEDGVLYRNMRNIVDSVGGKARGVLWYQGCSDCNADECDTYAERFRAMVERWREDLGDANLPFLTVQLNRYTVPIDHSDDNRYWGIVREQQRTAARTIPRVALVPAVDCPLSDEIHNSPAGNLLIGERTARAALAIVYGKDVHYRAPEISRATLHSDEEGKTFVELQFAHVGGYLVSIGPSQTVFTLEDDEGLLPVAEWTFSGNDRIRLSPTRALIGQAYVHGGFERNPAAYFPLDSLTYMPPLSFYKVAVE